MTNKTILCLIDFSALNCHLHDLLCTIKYIVDSGGACYEKKRL